MTRPVVDRFIHSQASRSRSHRAVIGYRLKPPFAGRDAEGESRQNLAQPVNSNPNVMRPGDHLAVSQANFAQFGEEGFPAVHGSHRVVRQEMAAVEIAFLEHTRHALNRREIKITVAINDADLEAHDLKEPANGVQWRPEVPCSMNESRTINFSVPNRPLDSQAVDDLSVNRAFDWRLEALFEHGGKLAQCKKSELVSCLLIPGLLPIAESRFVREVTDGLFLDRLRLRIAVCGVVLPREEDHAPIVRMLLLFRRLKRLLNDFPKMPAASSAPCGLNYNKAVFG